jgi:hypothetical protein
MSQKKTTPKSSVSGSNPLDEAMSLVKQIVGIVGEVPALTATDRKRSAKLRKGGETVIPTVAALSDQFGLNVTSYPTSTMTAKAKQAASLIPLHKLLIAATKQVADQMFAANSESWKGATVHYTMLKRLSRTNGDLAEALTPVRQFFASRTPSVVKAEDAKTGHHRGAKTAKKPASAPVANETAPGTTESASPAPAPTPVTPPVTTPAPAALAAAAAPSTPTHP